MKYKGSVVYWKLWQRLRTRYHIRYRCDYGMAKRYAGVCKACRAHHRIRSIFNV